MAATLVCASCDSPRPIVGVGAPPGDALVQVEAPVTSAAIDALPNPITPANGPTATQTLAVEPSDEGAVSQTPVTTPTPERITRSHGPYVVTVHESRLAVGLQVPPSEFAEVNAFERYHQETEDAPYPHFDVFPDWTKALFEVVPDAYEFVMFVLANEQKPEALMMNGFTQRVQNDVRGLGIEQFDYSERFGADRGVLATIILFTSESCLHDGPVLHEIGHRWGMNLFRSSHNWHNGFSSVGGQLGGFDTLETLDDGTFRAKTLARPDGVFDPISPGEFGSKNQIPYAPLELYAMGLAPAEDVPDTTVLANASWIDRSQGLCAGESQTFTIEQIVSGEARPDGMDASLWGTREPAYPDAPSAFSALAVYVYPEPVSDVEWAAFIETVRWIDLDGPDDDPQYNFWEATGGRATIDFAIALPPPEVGASSQTP